jgi:hypothetical protein
MSDAEVGIRELYAQAVAGTDIPRWRYFDRGGVGALLAEIDRLRADAPEVAALKAQIAAAYDRVAAQSDLLSRRAEAGTDG